MKQRHIFPVLGPCSDSPLSVFRRKEPRAMRFFLAPGYQIPTSPTHHRTSCPEIEEWCCRHHKVS